MTDINKEISSIFQHYFGEIRQKYLKGDFTELTLRTPFENFIKNLNEDYYLTQEPKRIKEVGAPDFKAFRNSKKIGYIETKDLGVNLDSQLGSKQLEKYVNSINNLILTDYCRFILIRDSKKIFDLNLFQLSDLKNSRYVINQQNGQQFLNLIEVFFAYDLPTIKTAKELAFELSKRAKLLRILVIEQLEDDFVAKKNGKNVSSIYDFYIGIKELLKDIKLDDCADAYCQTITYGLFLSKIHHKGPINRDTAMLYIPKRIGVIRRIFMNVAGDSVPSNITWIIDEIIEIMNNSTINKILADIDIRGKKDRDPFTFFYEDFLNQYDPDKRKKLGIYYTPRPVVSFIANSINTILKEYFDKPSGFADDYVTVLDPAVGTGTFFWIIYLLTLVELKNKRLSGLIRKKIEEHILKDFYGLEIGITPYIISHLKLSLLLKKWYYELKDNERIQIYLANTLEPFESHGLLPFLREISNESRFANELKTRKKILVVTGNPPYSRSSGNKGKWITDLLKKGYKRKDGTRDLGYYNVDGKPLEERNPKWLQDDYVKFIRFAQWKIDVSGEGVVGFITNHSFLDNPTFRGMRQSLMNSFNRIYILNLHGSSLKREKTPSGGIDENVFDIRPGVAITFFIKNDQFKDTKIFYADLFGTREEKYLWLDRNKFENVEWTEIHPLSSYYFFVHIDEKKYAIYQKLQSITEIFDDYSLSIQTHRDAFVVDADKTVLEHRIEALRDLRKSDDWIKHAFSLKDTSSWKLKEARKSIAELDNWTEFFRKINYRPFDIRWIFYNQALVDRMRTNIMNNMDRTNIALLVSRQLALPNFFHAFVTDILSESCLVSNKTKEGNYHFPLFKYENEIKKSNISKKLMSTLEKQYKTKIISEDVFYYIYAILNAMDYRQSYSEFLQYDFPRIPFVREITSFRKLSGLGKELAQLHLMKQNMSTETRFDVQGSNYINFVKFKNNKIHINNNQFFEGISRDIWEYKIGSYQVLDKWLKSRKDNELNSVEIELFLQIVEIIKKTREIVGKIDEISF